MVPEVDVLSKSMVQLSKTQIARLNMNNRFSDKQSDKFFHPIHHPPI